MKDEYAKFAQFQLRLHRRFHLWLDFREIRPGGFQYRRQEVERTPAYERDDSSSGSDVFP